MSVDIAGVSFGFLAFSELIGSLYTLSMSSWGLDMRWLGNRLGGDLVMGLGLVTVIR